MRTWFRGRRRIYAAGAVVVVAAAAAVIVPVTMADSEESCWSAPESVTRLAADPVAATRAFDPGADLAAFDKVRGLLAHERICNAQALGKAVESATVSAPGKAHTEAQARAAYAVAAAYGVDAEVPAGLEPYLARMLANHAVDSAAAWSDPSFGKEKATGPTSPGSGRLARPFWDQAEPRTAFEYTALRLDTSPHLPALMEALARDPEAFAVLYDAERAYLATFLEHTDPRTLLADEKDYDGRKTGYKEIAFDVRFSLAELAERVGALMRARSLLAESGGIADPGVYDEEVRRRLKGAYPTGDQRATDRPLSGDIARRPTDGKLSGDVFDGRHQLLRVLDQWIEAHQVPARTAELIRAQMDSAYVRGLAMRRL